MKYQHHRPFTIKVDLVQGCSLYHSYCGIRTIMPKAGVYRFMSRETATLLGKQLKETGWNARVEFEVFGEATEHPKLLELLSLFRKWLPEMSCTLTTNGSGLLKKPNSYLEKLSELVNVIVISHYPEVHWSEKIVERFKKLHILVEDKFTSVYNKKSDKNQHKVSVAPYIVECQNKLGVRRFANMGGTAAPLDHTYDTEPCARPFRDLMVNHDGNVTLCCVDWRGLICFGNIHATHVRDIWNSPEFNSVRTVLIHDRRAWKPCRGCNVRTVRTGLLPFDGMKRTVPFPKATSKQDIVAYGKLLTKPPLYGCELKQPWEKNPDKVGIKGFLK